VSLLDDDAAAAPHADGLAFATHDLCHLEKFVDPESHFAQVGFFRRLDAAVDGAAWRDLAARFDGAWMRDAEHVMADMNGSPVFLLAALKMKLKMAVRRAIARARGAAPMRRGGLDAEEMRAYEEALGQVVEALGFAEVRDAAMRIDATRAHRAEARVLAAWLDGVGRDALRA